MQSGMDPREPRWEVEADLTIRRAKYRNISIEEMVELDYEGMTQAGKDKIIRLAKSCCCPSVACPLHGLPDGSSSGGW